MNNYIITGILILIIIICVICLLKVNAWLRQKAYHLFLIAEHKFDNGDERMEYVLDNIYNLLPYPITIFISRDTFRDILQKLFDEIHDFLDDAKLNKSNQK